MIEFTTVIKKFGKQGEKSGWTYIDVPFDLAEKLIPDTKVAFRVKGKLDNYSYEWISLTPMGEGNFIMALKSEIRKALKKEQGSKISVEMEVDLNEKPLSPNFMECLQAEADAYKFFQTLAPSHQRYFSNWIETAKTISTQANRIAQAINSLYKQMSFGEMIRSNKKSKGELR